MINNILGQRNKNDKLKRTRNDGKRNKNVAGTKTKIEEKKNRKWHKYKWHLVVCFTPL